MSYFCCNVTLNCIYVNRYIIVFSIYVRAPGGSERSFFHSEHLAMRFLVSSPCVNDLDDVHR